MADDGVRQVFALSLTFYCFEMVRITATVAAAEVALGIREGKDVYVRVISLARLMPLYFVTDLLTLVPPRL